MNNGDKLKILTDLKNELNGELSQITQMKDSFNTLLSNINSVCDEYMKMQSDLESSLNLIDPLFEKIQTLLQESPFKKFHDRHTHFSESSDSVVFLFYILYEAKRFGGYAYHNVVTDFLIPSLIYGHEATINTIDMLFDNHSSIDHFLSWLCENKSISFIFSGNALRLDYNNVHMFEITPTTKHVDDFSVNLLLFDPQYSDFSEVDNSWFQIYHDCNSEWTRFSVDKLVGNVINKKTSVLLPYRNILMNKLHPNYIETLDNVNAMKSQGWKLDLNPSLLKESIIPDAPSVPEIYNVKRKYFKIVPYVNKSQIPEPPLLPTIYEPKRRSFKIVPFVQKSPSFKDFLSSSKVPHIHNDEGTNKRIKVVPFLSQWNEKPAIDQLLKKYDLTLSEYEFFQTPFDEAMDIYNEWKKFDVFPNAIQNLRMIVLLLDVTKDKTKVIQMVHKLKFDNHNYKNLSAADKNRLARGFNNIENYLHYLYKADNFPKLKLLINADVLSRYVVIYEITEMIFSEKIDIYPPTDSQCDIIVEHILSKYQK
jgi:hypothetical protein